VIPSRAIALAAAAAASLALGGCITVFPKSTPVQLYRFGGTTAAVDPKVAGAAPFNLQRAATLFTRPAQSDLILTSNGTETAYISGARWVAPATVLFDEAVARAFDVPGEPARVTPRGETGLSGMMLKLDVETFEASYRSGKDVAPVVIVRVRGLLTRSADRSVIDEQTFEAKAPADANRVGAIVHAFDTATAEVISQVVAWTDKEAAGVAKP
jgi:cholesterol transport system auxiliary component